MRYIPDSLEFPASVLAHITTAATLEPPNTAVLCTNCAAVRSSPVYPPSKDFPFQGIVGDYLEVFFISHNGHVLDRQKWWAKFCTWEKEPILPFRIALVSLRPL